MIIPRPFRGIVPPMVTPLLSPDTLDHQGLERLVEHLIGGGVHGLFILGTTGEGPALSYALRRELIGRVVDQVAGRIPVMVGVTDTSYVETLHLTEFAAKAGASAIVMAPPYYFHLSQSDLLKHSEALSIASPLPLFLYNMPGLTKVEFSPETVSIASDFPNIHGLKDSSGDIEYMKRVIEKVKMKKDFTLFLGPEALLVEGMKLGVHGGVHGSANLMPRLYVDLYEACLEGRESDALSLHERVLALGAALYPTNDTEYRYIRGLKAALSVLGICSDQPAWPYEAAGPELRHTIKSHLNKLAAIQV